MYPDITPDKEFTKTDKVPGPTKEEVRTLVISKLKIQPDDVIIDVGCGTGGLTLECAKRGRKVHSIDINPDAINTTRKNLEKFGLDKKVELIKEEGFKALSEIEDFNRIIIGGSGGSLKNIIEEGYTKLPVTGRMVITSIVLETATDSIETLKQLGAKPEVIQVNISRGRVLDRGVMMMALNPITIITVVKD